MAVAPMDALGVFTHLQTNLPTWITRVSDLAVHASKKHAEYTEAYRKHANFKPLRRKNSSLCSIHTDDMVPIAQQDAPKAGPEPVITTNDNLLAPPQQTGRKRGTDEAPSIDSGDRYTFVSVRHNVIIEYDGHTQKSLEEVVRDIGLARNHLRRSRMSMMSRGGLRAGMLSRTAAMGARASGSGSEQSQPAALSCVRSTRTGAGLVGVTGSTGVRKESSFDFADKQLELAHALCETAAYQVLRSGDCATELDGVEEKFKMLLEMAESEVGRLEEEKKQNEEQAEGKELTEDTAAKPPMTSTAARLARISALTANKPATTTAGTIEVDDASSISAESLDMSAFRSSRLRA
ncbi:hypothetical protein N7492_006149 [Penicillium capsulatum]|uniref:Uncharacterized protein n=1 Tax=Penicillium capsulatum TaxID=69766 RepID=A0A9W9I3D9_9EURO|nr:hypothetical protein N7492_006149 [Penicillium capsulatum]KAJ6108801.1 hypothetical protein N7512_008638 [Penicillium capsulatum]